MNFSKLMKINATYQAQFFFGTFNILVGFIAAYDNAPGIWVTTLLVSGVIGLIHGYQTWKATK